MSNPIQIKTTLTIEFSYGVDPSNLPTEAQLISWAENTIMGFITEPSNIDIRITDMDEIRALNAQFRQKDLPTNVLSFPADPMPGIENTHLGDIAICADIVAAEASQQCKQLDHHWAHLVTHSILHLLGYDHIDAAEAEEMESLEREILERINIPDPYLIAD